MGTEDTTQEIEKLEKEKEKFVTSDNDGQLTGGKHDAPITLQTNNEVNDTPPLTTVPEESPQNENTPEVTSPITHSHTNLDIPRYVLPFRHNRGKPPKRYSPDEQETKAKYPIANYVATKKLPKPIKAFTKTLSSHHIP